MNFCLCEFLYYCFVIFFVLHFLLKIQLVGVIAIFLGNVLDCVNFGVVISLVQGYVNHGMLYV